jgi:predicted ferric reductase
MVNSLHQLPKEIHLIYSVKTRSEMIEKSVLKNYLPKQFKNFTFVPYITDEQDGEYLDVEFIEKLVGELKNKEIFLCGPPSMMNSLKVQLREKGVGKHKIHSEEFTIT